MSSFQVQQIVRMYRKTIVTDLEQNIADQDWHMDHRRGIPGTGKSGNWIISVTSITLTPWRPPRTEMIIGEGGNGDWQWKALCQTWVSIPGPLAHQHRDRGTHSTPTGHSQLSTSLTIIIIGNYIITPLPNTIFVWFWIIWYG